MTKSGNDERSKRRSHACMDYALQGGIRRHLFMVKSATCLVLPRVRLLVAHSSPLIAKKSPPTTGGLGVCSLLIAHCSRLIAQVTLHLQEGLDVIVVGIREGYVHLGVAGKIARAVHEDEASVLACGGGIG